MTTERDQDTEPTVEIQRPAVPQPKAEIENDQDFDRDFDPERTLVREDWEREALRHLSRVVQTKSDQP